MGQGTGGCGDSLHEVENAACRVPLLLKHRLNDRFGVGFGEFLALEELQALLGRLGDNRFFGRRDGPAEFIRGAIGIGRQRQNYVVGDATGKAVKCGADNICP
jgi:hypothetical protein